jgi:DNA primase
VIGDDKVAEIRERTDIAALVGEYVALKRIGASFRGLCPFHSEKSPSFYVHPARQFFHCFGCQASGDVFKFVMQLEGRTFPETLRQLADRAGIELPKEDARENEGVRREKQKRERLTAITDTAAGFYIRMLQEHPLAGIARAELEKRRMSNETIATYRLGYAPHAWDALAKHLQTHGFSPQEAEEAGMIVPRKTGDGYYDRFRHRLMFPIADVHGRIVAFSGRALELPPGEKASGDPPAKYVNSPEGPLYKKGEGLFGLHEARVELRREGVAVLCEGNFDVLAVHQAGMRHVVAPLGTAFTLNQAKLLRRYVARVVLLFDGDKAGRKATRSAYPLLREVGLPASVVALPQGEDPDSFTRGRGADALKQLVQTATPVVDYLIEAEAAEAGNDPGMRAQAIEALGPVLASVESPVERGLYVERVAQAFQVNNLESVRQQLNRGVRAARGKPNPQANARRAEEPVAQPIAPVPTNRLRPADLNQIPGVERDLVGCFLDQPLAFGAARAEKVLTLLTSHEMEAILRAALRLSGVSGTFDAPSLLVEIEREGVGPGPARRWLEERLALQTFDAERTESFLESALPLLRRQQIEREQRELMRKIQEALREGETERASDLMKLRDELFRAAGALQRAKR